MCNFVVTNHLNIIIMKQTLKKFEHKGIVFMLGEINKDTELQYIHFVTTSASGRVITDYIYTIPELAEEALNGDVIYRNMLYEIAKKFIN